MSEKKTAVPAAPAAEVPASEPKTRKASGTPARRGRPPLTPEVYGKAFVRHQPDPVPDGGKPLVGIVLPV